jgi:NAD-reducing hydrogenase large subunit
MTPDVRQELRDRLTEHVEATRRAIDAYKTAVLGLDQEVRAFGVFPSYFLGLVGHDGTWDNYDGVLRLIDAQGKVVEQSIEPTAYREYFGEATESWSYLKSPYYLPAGYPDGVYRVGPLARLIICSRMGVPYADQELIEFRGSGTGAVLGSFH